MRLDREWSSLPRGPQAQTLPSIVRADRVTVRPQKDATAQGAVEFRRGGAVLSADRVDYDYESDVLRATGGVRISRDGMTYSGPALQMQLDNFSGWFEQPRFDFEKLGSGGSAERVEFFDTSRLRALRARYTSCPRDGADEPAWQLTADRVDLDIDANEGVAAGAVLRFLGTPILAVPTLSFPVTDARKSGWLPPNVNIDNRSGVDLSVPFYWNIAPNRDATISPRILTRRGFGVDSEFRYLERDFGGSLSLDLLPRDRVADRTRFAWRAEHQGTAPASSFVPHLEWGWRATRVSDDDWWKDFPGATRSIMPRLLEQKLHVEQPLHWGNADASWYARLAHWQVLQSADAIVSPYQRSPQLGLRARTTGPFGIEAAVETEFNRFTLARIDNAAALARPQGNRWHATASLALPWRRPGWWVVPGFSVNTALYATDGRPDERRTVSTMSIDAGASFERQTVLFGRSLRQVLEPRMHYVRTPFRAQAHLPNYESAGKDLNFTSIYSDNAWSGNDRISDSHQLTFGATTRMIREADGAEVLRLGLVQRLLLDPQRVTPDDADPALDAATPLTRRLSDLLLVGSTQIVPRWTFESAVRYNADTQRAVRSVIGARYVAPDYRTVSATYRFTRGQAEQIDFGWQWPLSRLERSDGGRCQGRLFSVGRVNYSMLDSRITDSLLGFEYDAGCWIGRIVAERVSTGRSEATTRLMLQLELIGLSRLGSNPLRALKDNIPGYRLLRDERTDSP